MSWKSTMPDAERFSYDYFFLDYVCRLCWGSDGVTDISSCSQKSVENEITIAEKIQECLGIDVSSYSHPKKICSKCLTELEIFNDFKKFCQETDRKLHGILQKGSVQQREPPLLEKEKLIEPKILKEETEAEFSNLELSDSIDDLLDDLPLSCEIGGNVNKPVRKEGKKRSSSYCNLCHMNLESVKNLAEHNLECHGIEENGSYKCFGCEKRFKSLKKRLRHESDTCKELKCGYRCIICERYLPKRRIYERHMRAHRENKEIEPADDIYKCKKCMKSFYDAESVREHMFTHYQKEKRTYICDICGRVFTRRDYLYKHKLVHEGAKMQKCPHCDYRAIQKSSLTVHMRKHTGERPYPCDLCPHRCVTSSNLREHRKRHFGIKKFECKLCDKKFGYKISLEEHMSGVHERSEAHTCRQCGSTYSRFRGLRRHLLLKHGKKVKKVKGDLVEVQNDSSQVQSDLNQVQSDLNQVQSDLSQVQSDLCQVQHDGDDQGKSKNDLKEDTVIQSTDGTVFMV